MLLLFFFNDTATTEIYTLSLHDALPISSWPRLGSPACSRRRTGNGMPDSAERGMRSAELDRKSTRLNSSHGYISYAVFCLKKKTDLKHRLQSALGDAYRIDKELRGGVVT